MRRKFSIPILAAVTAIVMLMCACAFPPTAKADNGTQALQTANKVVSVVEATTPAVQQGVNGIQQANGDPAAVIDATANAVSKVATAVAPVTPPPWSSYIAIVAIIANIIQALFHKQTVTSISTGAAPPTKGK